MELALQIVLVITSLLVILLVLLHRAKGGGLSTLFGGTSLPACQRRSVTPRRKMPSAENAPTGAFS